MSLLKYFMCDLFGGHDWDWEYYQEESCKVRLVCRNCELHDYGPQNRNMSNFLHDARYNDRHEGDFCKCKRCGKRNSSAKNHYWNGCKCEECGKVDYLSKAHDLNEKCMCSICLNTVHKWVDNKCHRCGEENTFGGSSSDSDDYLDPKYPWMGSSSP